MEEQRQRQEEEQRRALAASNAGGATEEASTSEAGAASTSTSAEPASEEAMLQRALAMSSGVPVSTMDNLPDFSNMTEEEQIAFAMQMSMQDARKSILNSIFFYLKNKHLYNQSVHFHFIRGHCRTKSKTSQNGK